MKYLVLNLILFYLIICLVKNLKAGVKIAKKNYETEASGNINLKTVKGVARTGVDRISVGCITHSAVAIDFKLEI